MRQVLLTAAVAACVASTGMLSADEEKVPLDKLPRGVVDAVKKRFPNAEIKEASRETEDGKTEYEVALKDGGKAVELSFSADGVLLEIEREVAMADVPKAVRAAVEAKYPKAMWKEVEEEIAVKDGKELPVVYEVELVTADSKAVEVKVAANGEVLEEEVEKSGKAKKDTNK